MGVSVGAGVGVGVGSGVGVASVVSSVVVVVVVSLYLRVFSVSSGALVQDASIVAARRIANTFVFFITLPPLDIYTYDLSAAYDYGICQSVAAVPSV